MKSMKLSRITAGICAVCLVVGMSVCASAANGKASSSTSAPKKGFFQCLYDACQGCCKGTKAKTTCIKDTKKSSDSGSAYGK
ncbi:MAG: hypothetical protein ABIH85_07400 [Candidatus Omnitrophota bacterium]|nr:hypothetical protein [Candidatus Omnitrophota bacterium]MBU1894803.1 hypothetical protein [Candidatus Omnitrophota bacterium]